MNSEELLQEQARELERRIQAHAFELLESSGDYEVAQRYVSIARQVGELASRLADANGPQEPALGTGNDTGPSSGLATSASIGGRRSTKYPCFFVENGRVVKLGRGKKRGAKAYRHEAPRESFDAVAQWLNGVSGRESWLARDVENDLDGTIPSYQVYLLIAALKNVGVVTTLARGKYTLEAAAGDAEEWWHRLASLQAAECPASGSGGAR